MSLAGTFQKATEVASLAAGLLPTVIRLVTGTEAAFQALRAVVQQHGDAQDLEALAKARATLQRIHDVAAREAEAES